MSWRAWRMRRRWSARFREAGHRVQWEHFRLATWVATCRKCNRTWGIHVGDYLSEHPRLTRMPACPGRRR